MKNLRRDVPCEQDYNGDRICFDPDSSPVDWEHYRKCYSENTWVELKDYNINELHFFEYINNEYVDLPLSFFNRLYALPVEAKGAIRQGCLYYEPQKRLAGETDFNFNEKKYNYFFKILFNDYISGDISKEELQNGIDKLKGCQKMHHTILNFSLIQCNGNLQGAKSKGLLLGSKYEYLDRLDTFVFLLDKCFKLIHDGNMKALWENDTIITNSTRVYRGYLIEYLKRFKNVEDYCEKVYFIADTTFIRKMIESGAKPILKGTDVISYMNLAMEFWGKKEEALGKIYV